MTTDNNLIYKMIRKNQVHLAKKQSRYNYIIINY